MRAFDFQNWAKLGKLMDEARREASRPEPPEGEIEMVEVAPQTFAPAPVHRGPRMSNPLSAALEKIQREMKKR